MATVATMPVPDSPKKSRVKKKVRMKEVVMEEDHSKPVDTFHVRITDVRAVLRVVEPRPVFLTFEFDNFWIGETNVYADGVKPRWGFLAASFRGHDGRKLPPTKDVLPKNGVLPEARFVYKTEFGYKLHRKFLVVKLAEHSPYGNVEWGTGVLPLDSIARGCAATELSIVGKDGVTVYGTVYCNIHMTNLQTVRAHLTDLRLSDYPEAYTYDVKVIYLEFGLQGFNRGFTKSTERKSDAEPRYAAQPALEWDTTLEDMLAISPDTGKPRLNIFFSVHRQVARTRTEQIAVGALPVCMLFSKVEEGWMDLPTRFKVPLANYMGSIRGKVLLRNIPQFSQLPGDDLVNNNGVILPMGVDLNSRKLLPWLKLPKSREGKASPLNGNATSTVTSNARKGHQSAVAAEATHAMNVKQAQNSQFTSNLHVHGVGHSQYHSPGTESASEIGSESSDGAPSSRRLNATGYSNIRDVDARGGNRVTIQNSTRRTGTSPLAVRDQIYSTDPEVSGEILISVGADELDDKQVTQSSGRKNGYHQPPKHEWMRGMRRDEEPDDSEESRSPLRAATPQPGIGAQRNEWMRGMRPEEEEEEVEEVDNGQDRVDVRANVTLAASKVLGGGGVISAASQLGSSVPKVERSGTARNEIIEEVEQGRRLSVLDAVRHFEWKQGTPPAVIADGLVKDENDGSIHNLNNLRISDDRQDVVRHSRKTSVDSGSVMYYDGTTWEESTDLSSVLRDRRNKSGKSVGSAGTGDLGGVEVGSLVLSTASDEGYGTTSRSTTEDAVNGWPRLNMGPPSEDRYGVEEAECNCDDMGEVDVSGYEYVNDEQEEEWMAIHDPDSSMYYFAHERTHESLWLPPEWERLEDENGRQVFVDHGKRRLQNRFPAEEAKAYRESVYTAGG